MRTIKDDEILLYTLDANNKLIPSRCSSSVLSKKGWLDYLKNRYTDNTTDKITEILYRLKNDIEQSPKCKICGKSVKYTSKGYPKYCSAKCSNADPEVLLKNKESVSKALKQKYIVDGDKIKTKRYNTINERYGTKSSSPFAVKEIQDKAKITIKEKYGVNNIFELPEYHAKAKETSRLKSIELWKERGLNISYTDNNTIIIENGCSIHGNIEMDIHTFNNRTKIDRVHVSDICPICNPLHYFSGYESIIKKFLDELNINYIINDRQTIKPLELDFYLPDYKLAIEFNGIFFHNSTSGKPKDYHKTKSERCEKLGIQLIHIWENDWIKNQDLIKSLLKNKLGKTDNIIYARNCDVHEVPNKISKIFLEENHLQGNVNAKYRYGLFYNNELVSIMTFGNVRKALGANKDDSCCELYRYCTKKNYRVTGGASKIFKYAKDKLKEIGYTSIITYAKRDLSNGNLYKKLGFEFVHYTVPGYFWVDRYGNIYNRFKFRKSEIIQSSDDIIKTESEIMQSKGYYKCYDSGNLKFKYKLI